MRSYKFKIFLTILCLANSVFSQETKSKLQFDVLDENNSNCLKENCKLFSQKVCLFQTK